MSVCLEDVLKGAGYDIKNNISDAMWLLSQESDWEELKEIAEEVVEEEGDNYEQ